MVHYHLKTQKKCMFIVINMFNWIIKKSFGRLMILILPFTTHSRFRRFSIILMLTFFPITLTKNTHFHGIHYLTNSSTMTWIFGNFPLSSSVIIDPTTLAPFARSLNHLASSSTPKKLKPLFFTLRGQKFLFIGRFWKIISFDRFPKRVTHLAISISFVFPFFMILSNKSTSCFETSSKTLGELSRDIHTTL